MGKGQQQVTGKLRKLAEDLDAISVSDRGAWKKLVVEKSPDHSAPSVSADDGIADYMPQNLDLDRMAEFINESTDLSLIAEFGHHAETLQPHPVVTHVADLWHRGRP